jgi:hypothetical protein
MGKNDRMYEILVVALLFVLIFGLASGLLIFQNFADFVYGPVDYERCAEEGEKIGEYGLPRTCCGNLTPLSGLGGYEGDCTAPIPQAALYTCADCGNGNCDIENNENKCNCPQDCLI